VEPATAVFGFNYTAGDGRWGGDLIWTLVAAKDREDVAPDDFRPAGYGIVDLLGRYRLGPRLRLNFGLFNIGDRRYVRWTDTRSLVRDAASGGFPEAGRYTQPGFNAGVTLRAEF
jgi:hemoglobin/transferrin/lactoferrin receptor protein